MLFFFRNRIIKLVLETEKLELLSKTSREASEIAIYWQSQRDSTLKYTMIIIFIVNITKIINSLFFEIEEILENPW